MEALGTRPKGYPPASSEKRRSMLFNTMKIYAHTHTARIGKVDEVQLNQHTGG